MALVFPFPTPFGLGDMVWSVHQALIVDALAAVGVHLYCRKNEPEDYWKLSAVLLALPLVPASLLTHHIPSLLLCLFIAFAVFFAALFSSMMLYRISPLHPLAGYPGPLLWRVTKFSAAYYGAFGKYHIKLKQLHDRYGPIVRIGPNELSIVQVELIPQILGSQGMPKGPLWEGRRILPSKNFNINNHLIGVRDLQRHAQLRKPWNKAFGVGPLKDYEEMLRSRAGMMGSRLDEICGEGVGRVDLTEWTSFFAFDFMGDIAFTSDFSLLQNGDVNGFVRDMEEAQSLPTIVQHVPWLAKITRVTPFLGTKLRKFGGFALEQAKKRAGKPMLKKDLFYHLIQAVDPEFMSNPLPFIMANAVLTILAGSDTTSSSMAMIFFNLLREPRCYKKLQKEIDVSVAEAGGSIPSMEKLGQLPYLNAVINEAMRLQAPVPTSVQRAPKIGSGGKMLGSMFLPEGTNVQVPPYVLHRDPRYFYPNPDSFWPERWLSQESWASGDDGDASDRNGQEGAGGIIHERAAFIPFSTGPAACAGKPLALMELRYVTAMLLRKFNFAFQAGFNAEKWEAGLADRLTMFRGPLPVEITRRGSI
ncbi:high nitrogen upregulated cytochrome P450 monooxygenase 2 [Coprinellus micaceus]|uniref:High nitrogen upregulated cytochrome P450 monooxygenase 2 n=1 Tax=Coprinellus micaceus TaxID=71717 RepID=A0A4Y7T900_COPMI|nr:high nitrogen upregulated cytochrome P450 monooxygenase 2 [Coprinellus micaceus]